MSESLYADAPPHVREVLTQLGYTLCMLQLLEDALASYLVVVHELDQDAALERAESAFETASRGTLGRLVKKVRGHDAPRGLVQRLEKFVPDRNWVAHHVFREHWGTLRDPADADSVIRRLESIAREALVLANSLADETRAYVVSVGESGERLSSLQSQILTDVRAGRSTPDRHGFRVPPDFAVPDK